MSHHIHKKWYTAAVPMTDKTSIFRGPVWICPECGYWPEHNELPHAICSNCRKDLRADGPGENITEIEVVKTEHGWKKYNPPQDHYWMHIHERH